MAVVLPHNHTHDAFLTNDPTNLRANLSHLSTTRLHRTKRNELYRSKREARRLPQGMSLSVTKLSSPYHFTDCILIDVRDFRQNNPNGHGFPHAYNINFKELNVDDAVASSLDNARLTFDCFGHHSGGLSLNGHKIDASHVSYRPGSYAYTFNTDLSLPVDGQKKKTTVGGFFDMNLASPAGSLHVNDRVFAVSLEPAPILFNAKVSSTAGAYWDTSQNKLVWDEKDIQWKNANWESNMQFAYRSVKIDDPIEDRVVIENYFTDTSSKPPAKFDLTKNEEGNFTSVFSWVNGQLFLSTTYLGIPPRPPASRKQCQVQNVFPSKIVMNIATTGGSFTGAYKDGDGKVYAIQGEAVDNEIDYELLSSLASVHRKPPAKNIFHFLEEATPHIAAKAPSLNLQAILGNDTMVPDKNDSSKFVDSVAQNAMKDFYSVIVYYMDDDLRSLFISSTPPNLIQEIKAIATSDVEKNRAFYKKLQVPYLTSLLAGSTLPEGKNCNGARAEKLMKAIPTEDPVYKEQSSAFYQFRYLEKFPETKKFLKDQHDTDYNAKIDLITEKMKSDLAKNTEGINNTNPEYQEDLKKAKANIDRLGSWAKERNLYWAFRLLYWVEHVSLPTWYALYTSGNTSSSIGMTIKRINGLFGVLENNQVNTAINGTNFMGAFNDAIRMFQMTSLIPQLIDLDGNSSDFDSLLKAMLEQFWNNYHNSSDPNLAEQANYAKELFQNDELRKKFILPFVRAQRFAGSLGSWGILVEKWTKFAEGSKWFQRLGTVGGKMLSLFRYATAASLVILPLLPGAWNAMSTTDKVLWGVVTAGLAASIVVKAAQGVVRLAFLWSDIAGWKDVVKTFMGFEGAIDKIPGAADQISNTFAKYFTRTAKQTVQIMEEEAATGVSQFSRFSRMFGRNMGEILGTVVGLTLAVVSLVLTSIALAKETEPLLIAVDILMIISASIQILAVVAGWVVASGITVFAGAVSALSLVASWGGPIGIAFALVGIIVLIVWMSTRPPPVNPVEKFVNDHVKPAGLYMNYLAIDYFDSVAASDLVASRVGITFQASATASHDPAQPAEKVYLRLKAGDVTSGDVDYTTDLDFTTDTVWSMQTDAYGYTRIATQKYIDQGEGKDKLRTVWYIATNYNNDLYARRMPSKKDEAAYKSALQRTQWTASVMAEPDTTTDENSKTRIATRALCQLSQTINSETKYLVLNSDPDKMVPIGLKITDSPSAGHGERYISDWMLTSESLGPVPFTYQKNPWTTYTNQKNERNVVRFEESLATSTGYKWSIDPGFVSSSVFELVTTAGQDEGMIRMKAGVTPVVTAKETYTVTCQLIKDGTPHGQQSARIDIEVKDGNEDSNDPDDN